MADDAPLTVRTDVPPEPTNPAHYRRHPSGVEAIELCELMDFCLGNALKYVLRVEHKGCAVQDLRKALWYAERALASRGTAYGPSEHVALPTVAGFDLVERFLRAEPSLFVRLAVTSLWAASIHPGATLSLQNVVGALREEIARREQAGP